MNETELELKIPGSLPSALESINKLPKPSLCLVRVLLLITIVFRLTLLLLLLHVLILLPVLFLLS